MNYKQVNKRQMEARIFRCILNDYFASRERNLIAALANLEQEVMRWLNRIGGMSGEW